MGVHVYACACFHLSLPCECQVRQAVSNHVWLADIPQFWRNMWKQTTLQTTTPLTRWDVDHLYDPDGGSRSSYARFAAYTEVCQIVSVE